jgi:hypothetical protein
MSKFGWIDGQTFTVQDRFAEDTSDIRQRGDVFLGSNQGALKEFDGHDPIPVLSSSPQQTPLQEGSL